MIIILLAFCRIGFKKLQKYTYGDIGEHNERAHHNGSGIYWPHADGFSVF